MTNLLTTWGALKTALSADDRARLEGVVKNWNVHDDTKMSVKVDDGLDPTPDWTWLFGLGVAVAVGVGLILAYRHFVGRTVE